MSSVVEVEAEGLASRPLWPVRVALLGWRLDQPRGQLGASAVERAPDAADVPAPRPSSGAAGSPHPAAVRRALRRRAPQERVRARRARSRRWKPAGPPPRARHRAAPIAPASTSEPRRRVDHAPRAWPAVVRWFRSFERRARVVPLAEGGRRALEPHPDQISILAATPANYGRAGLVALAACGVGIGAYLPWLSGTIDGMPFERTGLELGHVVGVHLAGRRARARGDARRAAATAALGQHGAGHRGRGCSLPASSSTSTSRSTNMNVAALVKADVGIGLWIMLVSAAGALIASFRIGSAGIKLIDSRDRT